MAKIHQNVVLFVFFGKISCFLIYIYSGAKTALRPFTILRLKQDLKVLQRLLQ